MERSIYQSCLDFQEPLLTVLSHRLASVASVGNSPGLTNQCLPYQEANNIEKVLVVEISTEPSRDAHYKKIGAQNGSLQLQQWASETSNANITFAERLEKSKWERK